MVQEIKLEGSGEKNARNTQKMTPKKGVAGVAR